MRGSSFRVAVLALALCVAACGGPQPKHVRVLDRKPPLKGCDPRGRVEGKGTSQPEARMRMRKAARDMGADTVWIDQPLERMPAGRTLLEGLAFRCDPLASEGAGAEQSVASEPAVAAESEPAPGTEVGVSAAASAGGDVPPSRGPAATPEPSLEQRLKELQALHDKGLITRQDYDARRRELLQEL